MFANRKGDPMATTVIEARAEQLQAEAASMRDQMDRLRREATALEPQMEEAQRKLAQLRLRILQVTLAEHVSGSEVTEVVTLRKQEADGLLELEALKAMRTARIDQAEAVAKTLQHTENELPRHHSAAAQLRLIVANRKARVKQSEEVVKAAEFQASELRRGLDREIAILRQSEADLADLLG
jgi:hypothetical protein